MGHAEGKKSSTALPGYLTGGLCGTDFPKYLLDEWKNEPKINLIWVLKFIIWLASSTKRWFKNTYTEYMTAVTLITH